jgi:hypothetical protein
LRQLPLLALLLVLVLPLQLLCHPRFLLVLLVPLALLLLLALVPPCQLRPLLRPPKHQLALLQQASQHLLLCCLLHLLLELLLSDLAAAAAPRQLSSEQAVRASDLQRTLHCCRASQRVRIQIHRPPSPCRACGLPTA